MVDHKNYKCNKMYAVSAASYKVCNIAFPSAGIFHTLSL
jgi:hypothetical protein